MEALSRIPSPSTADPADSSKAVVESKSKTPPPSWSWMAYTEGISFINTPTRGISWHDIDLHLTGTDKTSWLYARNGRLCFNALARDFTTLPPLTDSEWEITYDDPKTAERMPKKCIILGTVRDESKGTAVRHYILVITPKNGMVGSDLYERIGAGDISGACLVGSEKDAKAVEIV